MPLPISQAATDLIVEEEIGDRAYYNKRYQHWDWPEGASGPTVGVGYDCGYVTPLECKADWAGILPDDQIDVLLSANGRKGASAGDWVRANKKTVTIPYDLAMKQFSERELPKWADRTAAALPNCAMLHPDSFGALVSLAYNRGCSFDNQRDPKDSSDRFREMRAIKAAMRDMRFEDIPAQLRSMSRLWTGGVRQRRLNEAKLFEQGLAAKAGPATATPAPQPVERPEPHDYPVEGVVTVQVATDASAAKIATESRTLKLLGGAGALIASKIDAVGAWIGSAIDTLFGIAPDVLTDVNTNMDTFKSFGAMLKQDIAPFAVPVTLVLIAYAGYRHFHDKKTIAALAANTGGN